MRSARNIFCSSVAACFYWTPLLAAETGALPSQTKPAQTSPQPVRAEPKTTCSPRGEFFGLSNLWTFHLELSPEEWRKLVGEARPGQPARPGPVRREDGLLKTRGDRFEYVRANLEAGGKTFTGIGLRYKGNGAFGNAPKHPFKIDFNKYVKGQDFQGVSKLSLNNNVYDSSYMREALSYDVFRRAGVAAPRTAFARLYLTVPGVSARQYLGLYTAVEAVDEDFLRDHFGTAEGLLLKPDLRKESPFRGETWASYEQSYGQKTTGHPGATQRIIDYTRLVSQSDDPTFRRQISTTLDVDDFLRFLGVNTVLANLDSYLGMGKNYYMYLHPKTGKLHWIPWDLDLSFGAYFFCGTVEQRINLSLRHPYSCGDRLVERLLAIPEMNQRYTRHIQTILSNSFDARRMEAEIGAIAKVICDAVLEEGTISLQQFKDSLGSISISWPRPPDFIHPVGQRRAGILEPPLKVFIHERLAAIQDQLNGRSEGARVNFWAR